MLNTCRSLTQTVPTSFLPLHVNALRLDQVIEFDLYLNSDSSPVLYRERQLVMTQDVLERLRESRVNSVFVPVEQRAAMLSYLEKHLSAILSDPAVPLNQKATLMYFSAQELVRDIMENPLSSATLTRSRSVVTDTVHFLFLEERALASLLKITSYDYYTYTHSVNVMVYAISLARRVELGDEAACLRFGEATLLHDIGKSRISADIINGPGKLRPDQWEEVKRHPRYGCEILGELGVTDPLVLDAVLHHHEKLSGRGYPEGLAGDEVSPYARITTIGDIFDALTTRRSYKDAVSTFTALSVMKEELDQDLDQEYFHEFVRMLAA